MGRANRSNARRSHDEAGRPGGRLRSAGGADTVVLAAYLMASPEFAVVEGNSAPAGAVRAPRRSARRGDRHGAGVGRHVVEVQTGLPPEAVVGAAPRPGYDPAITTVMQRYQAKAAELGIGVRTVQLRRPLPDARLVAAVREVIEAETAPRRAPGRG
jgi:putative transposase